MGSNERRERERRQRFNQIVDAAEEVFFSQGVETATVDEVAEKAEVSKGTIYLYFRNKQDLYMAICLRAINKLYQMFAEAVRGTPNGLEGAGAIGLAYQAFSQQFPKYYETMNHFDMLGSDDDELTELARECLSAGHSAIGLLAAELHRGIKDGSVRPDIDPLKTAFLLWGQCHGVIQLVSRKSTFISEAINEDANGLYSDALQVARDWLQTHVTSNKQE